MVGDQDPNKHTVFATTHGGVVVAKDDKGWGRCVSIELCILQTHHRQSYMLIVSASVDSIVRCHVHATVPCNNDFYILKVLQLRIILFDVCFVFRLFACLLLRLPLLCLSFCHSLLGLFACLFVCSVMFCVVWLVLFVCLIACLFV